MRRTGNLILALSLTACAAAAPSADAARLPDLGMLEPRDFRIEARPDGDRWLRFDSIVVNRGPGTFEVLGHDRRSDGTLAVSQRIEGASGGATVHETAARMVFVGDGHEHWHVRDLQDFTIATADDPTTPLGRDMKVGFCFSDNYEWEPVRDATYSSGMCEEGADGRVPMGLSVGWADEYESDMAFQYLDVTGLPDGEYLVLLEADPGDEFLEADELNNAGWAVVQISGDEVSVVSSGTDIESP